MPIPSHATALPYGSRYVGDLLEEGKLSLVELQCRA